MIKSIWKNIRCIYAKIISRTRLTKGTISYDFWSVDEKLKKELEVERVNYQKNNISTEKFEKYASLFFVDTREKKHPFIKVYFNQEIARIIYEEEEPKDYFSWYEIHELNTKTIQIKEGEVKENETSMNFRVNPDWKVKYEIKRIPNDRKEIAGYMCMKYEITELKEIRGDTTRRQFKIYATNKIKLPGHLICNWYDKVIEECPLEMDISYENKESSVHYKVRNISSGLPRSIFEIPKIFRK